MNEDHPRKKLNRVLTVMGFGFGAGALWFGHEQPDNVKLWGGLLVACALFLQQDGLMQFADKVIGGITAWRKP